jgi:hypothetical protein
VGSFGEIGVGGIAATKAELQNCGLGILEEEWVFGIDYKSRYWGHMCSLNSRSYNVVVVFESIVIRGLMMYCSCTWVLAYGWDIQLHFERNCDCCSYSDCTEMILIHLAPCFDSAIANLEPCFDSAIAMNYVFPFYYYHGSTESGHSCTWGEKNYCSFFPSARPVYTHTSA